jgi:ribosomal protein S18 acetylase RimI-like enzyme
MSLQIIQLNKNSLSWHNKLVDVFDIIQQSKDVEMFHPHGFTAKDVYNIFFNYGKDPYYVITSMEDIVAYGLLRGWNDGYEIPSLGIYVVPQYRGCGISKTFMNFLHGAAKYEGAKKVRLTVYKNNTAAVGLYTSLGYKFTDLGDKYLGLIDL